MRFNNSEECMKSELDIFTVPPTQSSIEEAVWCKKEAESGYKSNSATVTFNIKPISDGYIDFSENFIHLKCSIRKKHPTYSSLTADITKDDVIGPVNNFLNSLFSQIEVKLNGTCIENTNKMYPYRAYIENLMNYDKHEHHSFLNNQLFYYDKAGKMESKDLLNITESYALNAEKTAVVKTAGEEKVNSGFINRRNRFFDGETAREVEMCGKLHLNLASSPKYLLNNVNVELILTRSLPEFCLFGNSGEYSVFISEAYLRFRKIKYSPSVGIGHALGLEKTNAKYPYKEVKMNSASIPAGSESITISGIHTGMVPNKILVGFVETSAFSGGFNRNPYNFQHFGLQSMLLQVGGQNIPYNEDLTFNFSQNQYAQAYNSLFQGALGYSKNITYDDYANGYTIYSFNLLPDLCSMNHFNILKSGEITLSVKFLKTTLNIHAIFYLEFDNILEITKSRVAITNNS